MAYSVHTVHSHAWTCPVANAMPKSKCNGSIYLFDVETAKHLLFAQSRIVAHVLTSSSYAA